MEYGKECLIRIGSTLELDESGNYGEYRVVRNWTNTRFNRLFEV